MSINADIHTVLLFTFKDLCLARQSLYHQFTMLYIQTDKRNATNKLFYSSSMLKLMNKNTPNIMFSKFDVTNAKFEFEFPENLDTLK